MLKILVRTIVALIVLAVGLLAVFIYWAQNPYGLEKERIAPKGDERLPAISPVQNSLNYLLFRAYEDNRYAVQLPVPNDYIHPSKTTSRLIKTYGASVTMYYPELNSVFHPSNVHLAGCGGHCGGRVGAYVVVKENGAKDWNERRVAQLLKDRTAKNPLAPFEDLQSEFGLSEHFQIRRPDIKTEVLDEKRRFQEYLIRRDANGAVEYMFECSPYSPSPGCTVEFNLSSRPELLVKLHFGRHLMDHWEDIIRAVDKKITSWHPVRVDVISRQ